MAKQINVGDLKEIRWNIPDAGQGVYFSKSGETHTLDPGGVRVDDSEDNLDTGGNFIAVKRLAPWCYEATVQNSEGDSSRMELETLNELSGSNNPTVFTFVSISGITYVATGSIVGDIKVDRQKGTISFKAMGGGNVSDSQFATQIQ